MTENQSLGEQFEMIAETVAPEIPDKFALRRRVKKAQSQNKPAASRKNSVYDTLYECHISRNIESGFCLLLKSAGKQKPAFWSLKKTGYSQLENFNLKFSGKS